MLSDDRTVHADMRTLDGDFTELVYYAKAGKWWAETSGTAGAPEVGVSATLSSRKQVNVSLAVGICLMAHKSEHGQWYAGRPGGRTLDARVRKALGTKRST